MMVRAYLNVRATGGAVFFPMRGENTRERWSPFKGEGDGGCSKFCAIVLAVLDIIRIFAPVNDTIMTVITINIPNHEVNFFKKIVTKMGWTYSVNDVVRPAATPKEKTLAKVDHALAQLRQMKEGQLQGINAEELLNEL